MNAFGGQSQFIDPTQGVDMITPTPEEREAQLDYVRAKTEQIKLENAKLSMDVKDLESSPDEAQIYPFFSDIMDVSVARFIQTSSMWSRRAPQSDITILLSSFGGSIVAGLAMHDHILGLRNKGHKVTIKGIGTIASMAVIVLQAASERVIGSNTVLMVHEGSAAFSGSMGELEDSGKMVKLVLSRCEKTICDRSGMTTTKYRSIIRRKDAWLSAEEALTLKLVDSIND